MLHKNAESEGPEKPVHFLTESMNTLEYIDDHITKTCLFKYIENFTTKYENFQMKNSGSFHIFAQNSLRGGSNEYHNLCF